jgi:hypothetical protein
MSNSVFPNNLRGLGFTVTKTPSFNTIVQQSPAMVELRIAQMQNPVWKWTLIYDVLRNDSRLLIATYTELATLMGFYLARQGKFDSFLFDDPDDDFIGPGVVAGVPNTHAELVVVNDGAGNYYSPIQRNMGGEFYEDITDLNGAPSVYANGVLQTGGSVNYFIGGPGLSLPGASYGGMYIGWVANPAPPVTISAHYYFRVRFDMDEQDFEKFTSALWTIAGPEGSKSAEMKLITARTTSV